MTHTLISGLNHRATLGQLTKKYRDHTFRDALILARRGLELPTTTRVKGVWAVAMVRNEQDVIAESVQHLLDQGVSRVVVMDNGSTDATMSALRAIGDERLLLGRDHETGYYQAAKMTLLSRWAGRWGAEWVVPFDADEFWSAPGGSLVEHLATCPADVARARIHNAFPTDEPDRWRLERNADALRKVAFRPHPLATLNPGNHSVTRPGLICTGIALLHLPWRSPEQLAGKLRQGAAAIAAMKERPGWGDHWQEHGSDGDQALAHLWDELRRGRPVKSLNWSPSGGPTAACETARLREWLTVIDPGGEQAT